MNTSLDRLSSKIGHVHLYRVRTSFNVFIKNAVSHLCPHVRKSGEIEFMVNSQKTLFDLLFTDYVLRGKRVVECDLQIGSKPRYSSVEFFANVNSTAISHAPTIL